MAGDGEAGGKRALLGKLRLDEGAREAGDEWGRWVALGAASLALGALALFWLAPGGEPVLVRTAAALPVAESGGGARGGAAVLDATGYVSARRQATVSSKVTGKVREVFIEEGDQVEEGQLLATLDDSTQAAAAMLAEAQQEAAQARLSEVGVLLQEAELEHERIVQLRQRELASAAALDQARLAVAGLKARLLGAEKDVEVAQRALEVQRQQLEDMQIRAPFAGVVVAKAAQPGEMISPMSAGGSFTRTGICTLVDMESLEIEVDVNEAYINRVEPGQPVAAMLNSYPNWRIPSEVITIIPTADRSKATVRVRIGFLETDPRILPDMGVRVAFLEARAPEASDEEPLAGVLVPSDAVAHQDGANLVFVVAEGRAQARKVRLGPRTPQGRNVRTGLAAGEEVVIALDKALLQQLGDGVPVRLGR